LAEVSQKRAAARGEYVVLADAVRDARAKARRAREVAAGELEKARRHWERSLALARVPETHCGGFVVREPGLRGRLGLRPSEDSGGIHEVRAAACAFLREGGVPEEAVEDLEFVVGELCSNVARHARSAEGRFLLVVDHYPSRVVVTVKDGGPGFAPELAPPPGSDRPDGFGGHRIGGLGLPLVARLCETVEFCALRPHGMMARAVLRLPVAPPS